MNPKHIGSLRVTLIAQLPVSGISGSAKVADSRSEVLNAA